MDEEQDVETPLAGGWVTHGVVRIGDTIRRPISPNGPFVHRLLRHLEAVGFVEAPRFLGLDDQGREILSYLDGEVFSDCRSIIWTDSQLVCAAELLRRYHDATAESGLTGSAEVVCHHDFGPWNLVWAGKMAVGIIDFDGAAPGARVDDLGYAVWKHLNLGLVDLPPGDQARRLRVLAGAYGATVNCELIAAVEAAQTRMGALIRASEQLPGRDDALAQHDREERWLRENRSALLR